MDVGPGFGGQFGFGRRIWWLGQKCTASSRLVVHSAVHDAFVEKLAAATQAMVVEHALLGLNWSVVSEQQLQSNLDYVQLGLSEGAELITEGQRLEMATPVYATWPVHRHKQFDADQPRRNVRAAGGRD